MVGLLNFNFLGVRSLGNAKFEGHSLDELGE